MFVVVKLAEPPVKGPDKERVVKLAQAPVRGPRETAPDADKAVKLAEAPVKAPCTFSVPLTASVLAHCVGPARDTALELPV